MFIEEREVTGALEFVIRLTATDPAHGLNLRPFGPFRLEVDPAEFFESFFQEIEELPLETPEQRQVADRKLAAKGSYLSETLLPPDLRETLWGCASGSARSSSSPRSRGSRGSCAGCSGATGTGSSRVRSCARRSR